MFERSTKLYYGSSYFWLVQNNQPQNARERQFSLFISSFFFLCSNVFKLFITIYRDQPRVSTVYCNITRQNEKKNNFFSLLWVLGLLSFHYCCYYVKTKHINKCFNHLQSQSIRFITNIHHNLLYWLNDTSVE